MNGQSDLGMGQSHLALGRIIEASGIVAGNGEIRTVLGPSVE